MRRKRKGGSRRTKEETMSRPKQTLRVPLDLKRAERMLCVAALMHTQRIYRAAELLGIDRNALARRIAKHGIKRNEWRI